VGPRSPRTNECQPPPQPEPVRLAWTVRPHQESTTPASATESQPDSLAAPAVTVAPLGPRGGAAERAGAAQSAVAVRQPRRAEQGRSFDPLPAVPRHSPTSACCCASSRLPSGEAHRATAVNGSPTTTAVPRAGASETDSPRGIAPAAWLRPDTTYGPSRAFSLRARGTRTVAEKRVGRKLQGADEGREIGRGSAVYVRESESFHSPGGRRIEGRRPNQGGTPSRGRPQRERLQTLTA